MTPMARSFYAESKRIANALIKRELGVRLIYPDYRAGLAALLEAEDTPPEARLRRHVQGRDRAAAGQHPRRHILAFKG